MPEKEWLARSFLEINEYLPSLKDFTDPQHRDVLHIAEDKRNTGEEGEMVVTHPRQLGTRPGLGVKAPSPPFDTSLCDPQPLYANRANYPA